MSARPAFARTSQGQEAEVHIIYFIPGPMSQGPLGLGELDRRKAYLERHAAPGTLISVRESADGPASIESAAEEYLAVPGLLAAAPVLESEGTNAIIVGCFGDPGLSAARELTGIPVVGPGQASGHLAAQLGSRFAILTVVDEVVPAIRRQMRGHGLEGFLSEVRAVDVPVLELRQRRDEVLGTLEQVGREVIDSGADALVLGCMTMGFVDVARDLQSRLGVPVVNPVVASLKLAEAMVSAGVAPSARAYPAPRKPVAISRPETSRRDGRGAMKPR